MTAENNLAIIGPFKTFQSNPDLILLVHRSRSRRKSIGSDPGVSTEILCHRPGYTLIQWFSPACRCRVVHLNSSLHGYQTALCQIGGYVNAAHKNTGSPGVTGRYFSRRCVAQHKEAR